MTARSYARARIVAHLVTRALDRAHRAADAAQRDHPELRIEVDFRPADDLEADPRIEAADPSDPPWIRLLVSNEWAHLFFVDCPPGLSARGMYLALDAAIAKSPDESDAA